MDRIDRGLSPVIYGDGKQTMDFVYVEDVARANALAATSGATGEVFNVASGVETSLNELAQALLTAMGRAWRWSTARAQGECRLAPIRRSGPGPGVPGLRDAGGPRRGIATAGRVVATPVGQTRAFPPRARGGGRSERGGLRSNSCRARLGRRRPARPVSGVFTRGSGCSPPPRHRLARAAVPGRLSLARRRRRAHIEILHGLMVFYWEAELGRAIIEANLELFRHLVGLRSRYPALPLPARGASRKPRDAAPLPSRHVLRRERPRGLRARALDGHGRGGPPPRDQRLAREPGLGLSLCPAGEPGRDDPVAEAPARLPLCPPAPRPPPS